jgi:hypothetical protein
VFVVMVYGICFTYRFERREVWGGGEVNDGFHSHRKQRVAVLLGQD